VSFYHELLQEQAQSSKNLEYWLDYVHEFGVDHLIPAYEGMTVFEYNNGEVWCLLFAIAVVPILSLLACCNLCNNGAKTTKDTIEEDTDADKKKKKKKD